MQNTNNIKQHVLLVDDDTALCRLFGGYLQKAGFEILYAHNGNEGREIARRLQPDIILLDLDMPVMDGYEASMRLKSEELTKKIPIIILTNTDIPEEAEKLFKSQGVSDYLHKSVDEKEFIERIKKILNS